MRLSKTDFILYLNCPKSFWLLKHEPENFTDGEFSSFMAKLVREGYEVERHFRKLMEEIPGHSLDYQRVYETDDGLHARLDGFETTPDGLNILYEVKSSTKVKETSGHNQIKDACFQKICAERAGTKIDKVFLVHLNGDYVRDGDIDPAQLLKIEDVTIDVAKIQAETATEIDAALEILHQDEIDRTWCPCLFKSRANHCDTFSYFNSAIPKYSIYSLPRLSQKKRDLLVNEGIYDLKDIDSEFELSEKQLVVLAAAQSGEAQVSEKLVRALLAEYQFPLYFFDFETFASAIPMIDGASPHKHFPVQYSLHIMQEDGSLEHQEFLQREARMPLNLVEQMEGDIGSVGSIVSWHASFEKTQNRNMADWFPDKAAFLHDVNARMVDLEDIFKEAYVDIRFNGSTSIKKVLPVICPHLGYEDLNVQDGAAAMDAWKRMIEASPEMANKIAGELLEYCEMDTYAMVEIYRFLIGKITS